MKMTWTTPDAVLRVEAETPDDLDTVSTLTNQVLSGVECLYATSEDCSPLYSVRRGQRSGSCNEQRKDGFLLVGFVWDIRNQPNAGKPKSDADVRAAKVAQAICYALHEAVGLIQAEAKADLPQAPARVTPI